MTEDLFFKIVIGVLVIGFIANFIQDYLNNEYTKEQLKKLSASYGDLWAQINRIDNEFLDVRQSIIITNKQADENRNELKADIMFWEKQRDETMDKFTFDNGVITNRLNSHAKKIVYVKKVLDKLFDHKVEIKHKAKLVKLEGELDKW